MPRICWSDTFFVRCYELAREGHTDAAIAGMLGVSAATFGKWKVDRPALREALERGRKAPGGAATSDFRGYVYARLPPHLKELWERINLCEEVENGVLRLEALLSNAGKEARQHLFFYALISSGFNPSEACRKVNISKSTLDGWVKTDPAFAELLEEVHWHKGNFFESALVERVVEGDGPCTMFANKTFNRARGYGDHLRVEGEVRQAHLHFHGTVADLDLPLETMREILQAARRARASKEKQGEERSPGDDGGRVLPVRPRLPAQAERLEHPQPPPERAAAVEEGAGDHAG